MTQHIEKVPKWFFFAFFMCAALGIAFGWFSGDFFFGVR